MTERNAGTKIETAKIEILSFRIENLLVSINFKINKSKQFLFILHHLEKTFPKCQSLLLYDFQVYQVNFQHS